MTWDQLLAGALGSSPVALVMAYAVRVLWARLLEREAKLDEIRDALLAAMKGSTNDGSQS